MAKKLFFASLFVAGGFLIAVPVFADCQHIYQGINCGSNWYCNGCVASCPVCPGGAPGPANATVLNSVSCTCGCGGGQIICDNLCTTPVTSCPSDRNRENASTCPALEGCGACKAGYSPDPTPGHESAPHACIKAAYMDYANTGNFQVSGNITSTGGDLYLASGKAIRVDGTGITTLNIGNWGVGATRVDLTLLGGLVVGSPLLGSQGVGTINAEKLCIQGSCRDVWPAAVSAFVNGGNTGFGPTAVLGTKTEATPVPLSIITNGTERMRIDATTGNVGIGTASPGVTLDVNGVINAATGYRVASLAASGNYLRGNGTNFVSSAIQAGDLPSGSGNYIWNTMTQQPSSNFNISGDGRIGGNATVVGNLTADTADNTLFVDATNNLVGIGTAAPIYKLVVSGDTPHEYIWATSGNPELDLGNGTDNNHWAIYRDSGNQLNFWGFGSGGDNRMVISSAGNVGIGTTSPAYKLDVAGQVNANTSATPAIQGITSATGGYGGSFQSSGANGYGIYSLASNPSGGNLGGYFQANGPGSTGIQSYTSGDFSTGIGGYVTGAGGVAVGGVATSTTNNNYGGSFSAGGGGIISTGQNDFGVWGAAQNSPDRNFGGLFTVGNTWPSVTQISAPANVGVAGIAREAPGTEYAGYFSVESAGGYGVYARSTDVTSWAGYFTGGKGVFTPQLCLGTEGNCRTDWPAGGGGTIGGGGTTNYLAKFTAASSIGNSQIYDDGANVGVGTAAPAAKLDVNGTLKIGTLAGVLKASSGVVSGGAVLSDLGNVNASSPTHRQALVWDATTSRWIPQTACLFDGFGCPTMSGYIWNATVQQASSNFNISGNGVIGGSLTVASLSGVLKASGGLVSGGSTTSNLPEGSNLYYTDARARNAISAGAGPVNYTPATGVISFSSPLVPLYGGTGGTATPTIGGVAYGTGSAYAFTAAGTLGQFLQSNDSGAPTWATIPSGINGSGTENYLPKFTAGTTVGNSQIYDNGTNVGIGTTVPNYKLDINGTLNVGGNATIAGNTNINSNLTVSGGIGAGGLGWSSVYGIRAQGTTAGGYFKDSDSSAYADIAYGDMGAYVYGNNYGVYVPAGGLYGVYAVGSSYAGYFSGNVLATGNLSTNGDLAASNNTLSSCFWVSVPSNLTSYSCVDLPSAGNNKIMAGIYKNASGVVAQIQCCEL